MVEGHRPRTPDGKAAASRKAYEGGQWLILLELLRMVNTDIKAAKNLTASSDRRLPCCSRGRNNRVHRTSMRWTRRWFYGQPKPSVQIPDSGRAHVHPTLPASTVATHCLDIE